MEIEAKENVLTIRGVQNEQAQNGQGEGRRRPLIRALPQLAEHVEVSAANMDNGLLHIDLVRRLPESLKPRKISNGKQGAQQTNGSAEKRRVGALSR